MLLAVQDAAPALWLQLLGGAVIILSVAAIVRGVNVQLALIASGLALGALGGRADAVVRVLLATLADERFVVPICTALGFSYVLRHTGCDRHLVHALIGPVSRVRFLLVPGTVIVGYVVNMPVVSQAATATAIGPVAIPILRAANVSPVTTGAALLLGCSIGGELLNPGAPELRATIARSRESAAAYNAADEGRHRPPIDPARFDSDRCVHRVLPLSLIGLAVATTTFWLMAVPFERRAARPAVDGGAPATFRVNPVKAVVPLLPLVLLYLAAPPVQLIDVPREWLEESAAPSGRYETRLVGAAMLLGAVVAVLAAPRRAPGATAAFFAGAGWGYGHVISLIVAANGFGAGVAAIGLAEAIGSLTQDQPALLLIGAAVLPLAFAALCGSGMAATQSLVGFFTLPALQAAIDPTHVGALISLCAAAGRTMSPAAAVGMICGEMTATSHLELCRRVVLPLILAAAAMTAAALVLAPAP